MSSEDSAPGWEAIDRALQPLYGRAEPVHWAPQLSYVLGGPDPLDGISAYSREAPVPHWHFVTYGFSELYSKDSKCLETSGFGFELTFRLRSGSAADPPPLWVYGLLQAVARYVFSSGNVFDVGHTMKLNGPILNGSDTQLQAIAFARDPELQPIQTPHGNLKFLQVVGITLDERLAMKTWNTESVLNLAAAFLPLLMTDLDRTSLTDLPEFSAALRAGGEKEGPSTSGFFVPSAEWRLLGSERLELVVEASDVGDLMKLLPMRIAHGRDFFLSSEKCRIRFEPASQCSWAVHGNGEIQLSLTPDAALALAGAVAPKEGLYQIAEIQNLSVRVVKSEIKNASGEVIEVVG